MMKNYSDYQKWLMEKFNGKTPKESIKNKIDSLISETHQELPINLYFIAKQIGINPKPLYEKQIYNGSILIHRNELRISMPEQKETPKSRFTYAHELIHCLAYDLKQTPPKRAAPMPDGLDEEWICNYGASNMLLPAKLINQYFMELGRERLLGFETNNSVFFRIRKLAEYAKASIQTVVIQLFEHDIIPHSPFSLYILSSPYEGYHNRGKRKPRCVKALYYDSNNKKQNFLQANQGLQHIKGIKSDIGNWSLLNLFNSPDKKHEEVDKEFVQRDTDGRIFTISGTHYKITDTKYIWSELNVEYDNDIDIGEAKPIQASQLELLFT